MGVAHPQDCTASGWPRRADEVFEGAGGGLAGEEAKEDGGFVDFPGGRGAPWYVCVRVDRQVGDGNVRLYQHGAFNCTCMVLRVLELPA